MDTILALALAEGEGFKVEFKERLSNLDREMVAFANTAGGTIYLGIDDAWVQCIHRNTCSAQQFRQMQGEECIGEFRVTVRDPVFVIFAAIQVVKLDTALRCPCVCSPTGDHHDSSLPRHVQTTQQAVNQYHMAQMVDREMFFHAICKHAIATGASIPGVANKDIERQVDGSNSVSAVDY